MLLCFNVNKAPRSLTVRVKIPRVVSADINTNKGICLATGICQLDPSLNTNDIYKQFGVFYRQNATVLEYRPIPLHTYTLYIQLSIELS